MAQGDILLGDGVFSITTSSGATAITFLTRGGGKFSIEQDIHTIEADGDFGPVMGRERIIKQVPKLTIRALEYAGIIDKFLAGSTLTTTNSTQWTGSVTLSSGDYMYEVSWTGETLDDRDAVITIKYALPTNNLELDLSDKDEIIAEVEFVGHYTSSDRTTPPWIVTVSTG
jgi:hypothetical protein